MRVHKTSNISAPCVPRNADSHVTGLEHNHVDSWKCLPQPLFLPGKGVGGLHPWMAYYCSMTDILQYIYISLINPRVWYWCISPHFILLVQTTYCRLYSMACICCSAPSACHPSTTHLQTARTLRSAIVTTNQNSIPHRDNKLLHSPVYKPALGFKQPLK